MVAPVAALVALVGQRQSLVVLVWSVLATTAGDHQEQMLVVAVEERQALAVRRLPMLVETVGLALQQALLVLQLLAPVAVAGLVLPLVAQGALEAVVLVRLVAQVPQLLVQLTLVVVVVVPEMLSVPLVVPVL